MEVFGPVPSRRLGRSLGINNIPPKHCSYACVYCQVGPTTASEIVPGTFFEPRRLYEQVARRLDALAAGGERVDYLTFVPDGEPTLDARLGETIALLRPLGIPVAVISNGSLLYRDDVRERLADADWVSVKVDSTEEDCWRRINRPHHGLDRAMLAEGQATFAGTFRGTLVTETMLVREINDSPSHAAALAGFLAGLAPAKAYLAVPTRPTVRTGVEAPDEATLTAFHETLRRTVASTELLVAYEGDEFAAVGDISEELLAIAAVHPLRTSAVRSLLEKAGAGWAVVDDLVSRGQLVRTDYAGETYYLRRIRPAAGKSHRDS